MLESDQSLIRLIDSWTEKGPCKIRKRKEGFFLVVSQGRSTFTQGFAVILDHSFGADALEIIRDN